MTVHTIFGPWTVDGLAVLEVSSDEWRMSDLRRRDANGPAIVGLVRKADGLFYATTLPLHRAATFCKLEDAIGFVELGYLGHEAALEDTMPWPMPDHGTLS